MRRPYPYPPSLEPTVDLLDRIDDLNAAIGTIEGIFNALLLLAGEFAMDGRTEKSSAYRALLDAGLRSSSDAQARAAAIHDLFFPRPKGGFHGA